MFFGVVFASPNRNAPQAYASYIFSVCLVMFLFLPRSGTLEIDVQRATLSFRESIVAWSLHIWRKRRLVRIELLPGSKMQFGSWMKEGGFVVFGLQVSTLDGKSILVFDDFRFSPALAILLNRELSQIDGVKVFPLAISRDYQTIEWKPRVAPSSAGGLLALGYFILLFAGMLFAVLGFNSRALTMIGIASVATYAVFRILIAVRTRRSAGEEKPFTAISVAFSILYFALTYAVLTLVGTGIASRQP